MHACVMTVRGGKVNNMADREILNVIPPVVLQEDCKLLQAVVPLIPGKENAPPYNCPVYISIPHPGLDIENVSFDMIYQFMIDRKRQTADTGNVSVNSFKALDRAVSHFQAGDVSEVMAAEVTYFIYHIVYVCETRVCCIQTSPTDLYIQLWTCHMIILHTCKHGSVFPHDAFSQA